MSLTRLALKSINNRRFTSALTAFTIALSVFLLLSVERVRVETREGFTNTISGTDLIVGARSGSVQLLLYSIFHIGDATNNISWSSFQELKQMKGVDWTVPLSLGDSHRGFRVVGTTSDFFTHYRYSRKQNLVFAAGELSTDVYHAVIGSEVANDLGYEIGSPMVIAHGTGSTNILKHDDKPFSVSGILRSTGTPIDRSILVTLEGIQAIHIDWAGGVPNPNSGVSADDARQMNLQPESVTAALIGLKSKIHTFKVQRLINDYPAEPLLAILPGVALAELWRVMSVAEQALLVVGVLVVLVGLSGMMTALLTSLSERRREIAILRALGAHPIHVLGLLLIESLFLALAGIFGGFVLLYLALTVLAPVAATELGIHLSWRMPGANELWFLAGVFFAAFLAGLVPGLRAYRYSLSDGLSVKT